MLVSILQLHARLKVRTYCVDVSVPKRIDRLPVGMGLNRGVVADVMAGGTSSLGRGCFRQRRRTPPLLLGRCTSAGYGTASDPDSR